MIIKKIKLKNIRSYEEAEIDFPLGSTLLAGDIGTGKTSILLAIEFALFGLQPGQKGSSLLRTGCREGKVVLYLDIDGKDIVIERNLKKGKSINQGEVFITIDGKKQQLSVNELKNKIIELINYPKEFIKKTNFLYRFTVYTPQEEMKQIILETPETRLNTLRHIFGIDKYKRITENITYIAQKIREISKEYEGEIKNLENKEEELKEKLKKIEELKRKIEEKNNLLNKIIQEREKKEKEIEEIKKQIEEKEKYEKEAEKIRVMIAGKKELKINLEKEKNRIDQELKELQNIKFDENSINQLEKEKEEIFQKKEEINKDYLNILSKINSLTQKKEEINKLKNQISLLKVCPTCLQEVKEEYKIYLLHKFDDDLIKWEKDLQEMVKSRDHYQKSIREIDSKILKIDSKLRDLKILKIRIEESATKKKRIDEILKEINLIDKDILMLEEQFKNLREVSTSFKKYETFYENKTKELEEIREEEKREEIKKAEIIRELEVIEEIVKNIKKEIERKNLLKEKLIYIKEIEDYLSSSFTNLIKFIEKNMMIKLREEFSKLFSEWFSLLVPETFSSHLDEDFTPIIEQQGYQLDYSFLSGGERTAVALAYRLALNQLINSMMSKLKTKDIIILDEPTDGFSEQQLDKVRDMLQQLNVKQLIIVSHEPKIESFVQNIIRFKKENGISYIE